MFKKDPRPGNLANIKSSERRRVYTGICELYKLPKDKISKETERKILPQTTKHATFKSVQNYQGAIYYNEVETPLWFMSRDSDLYPSVFCVWENPFLVPKVMTHPHVIEVLYGGADLMLPGCRLPFDKRIKKGDIVGITGSDYPDVVKAIGIASMDLGQIDKVVGTTGCAVKVLHTVGDALFKLNQLVDIKVPKEVDTVVPWPEEEPEEVEVLDQKEQEEVPEEKAEADGIETQTAPELQQPLEGDVKEQEKVQKIDIDDVANQVDELRVQDLDHLFTRALLQAIKLETIILPVNNSNFMSNYVLKNLPQMDSKYKNIKKTSWKKTGKFLKAMTKLGYIQVKGKDDDLTITGTLPKTDKIITDFETHKVDKPKKKGGDSDSKEMAKLIQLYQPTNKYRMFFNKVDEPYACLYTNQELKTLITEYIKKNNLVDPKDPKFIMMDGTLGDIIPLVRTGRNEIVTKFLKFMTPKYVIVKPGDTIEESEVYSGELPKLQIVCETKIGRKTITRVKNFDKFGIKPHIISADLRNICQGSTTLEEEKGNVEVIVQGPHYKLIQEYLVGKGVPNGSISYEDKSKKKKKRG